MAEPFLAEIRIASFNVPPKGWAFCDGQLLPINQNQALFSLLGTTYGGNGQTTFALPDLRGRTPIHVGNGHVLGESAGEDFHTLVLNELPTHTHVAQASSADGTVVAPADNVLAGTPARLYSDPLAPTVLHPSTVSTVGGSQPHENRQPFLVLSFIIALQGIFPSRN